MINKQLIAKFLLDEQPIVRTKGNVDLIGMIDCNNSQTYLTEDEFIYYFCNWINKKEEENNKNVKKETKSSKKA